VQFFRKVIFIIFCFILFTTAAEAQQLPKEEWTQETQLWAARMLFGEATFQFQDIQILFVVKRLWLQRNKTLRKQCKHAKKDVCEQVTFLDIMRQYSAAVRPGHDKHLKGSKKIKQLERWLMVQELPWGDYDGWTNVNLHKYNKKWATWRKLVNMWYNGKIKDVCPSTMHWGGRHLDAVLSGYAEVECSNDAGGFLSEVTPTVNAMQAKAKRRKLKGTVPARAIIIEFASSN